MSQQDFIETKIIYDIEEKKHRHKNYELLYVLEGKINLFTEETRYSLDKHDIILINSDKIHEISRVLGSREKSLCLSVDISWNYLYEHTGNDNLLFWCISSKDTENSNYDRLREVLNKIVKDYVINKDAKYFIQNSNYYLLLHILMNYFVIYNRENQEEKKGISREKQLANYIQQNYAKDLSLSDIADKMSLSNSYVSRYFKKTFGMNFIDYLYDVRLSYAENELVHTTESITDITFENGFPNVATFNKLFKKKYLMTPSEYRTHNAVDMEKNEKNKKIEEEKALGALNDYLGTAEVVNQTKEGEEVYKICCNIKEYKEYFPIWNIALNLGPAETLLDSSIQQSILYAKKNLKIKYGRFWSLFSPNMYTVGQNIQGTNRFYRVDRIISFLLDNDIIPIIELGEKQNRIQKSVSDYLKESDNTSLFTSYEEFLEVLEEMMKHLVAFFSENQVNTWKFEVWDDRRVEVYHDKQPYIKLFQDVFKIVKKYAPKAMVGGAGNYLGWFKEHTEESVRMWIDMGVYPDFLTYTYLPYAKGEIQSERMSKRKSDENDLKNSLDDLNDLLLRYGFPDRKVFITDWNMTSSSRNYFNDSLWKACYVVRCCIDNLGSIDALVYSQLQDATTDYYDNQQLLNGSGGLLTRDMIEKPAFMAMKLLRHLQKYLVKKGKNYIITRDEYGKITILMHNFISRNYLYYVKEENENTLEDHYKYFKHQNTKTLHFRIENVLEDTEFQLHHHLVNRKFGSIMDEWAAFGFKESLQNDDIEYLKRVTVPKIFSTAEKSEGNILSFDVDMEPLEIRCISIRPIKM